LYYPKAFKINIFVILNENQVSFANDLINGRGILPDFVWLGQRDDCTGYFGITDHMGSGSRYVDGLIKAPSQIWYHLACVFQNLDLIIYVNGISSTMGAQVYGSMISSSSVNYTRLFNYFGKTSNGFDRGNFVLDDVRLYNRALSNDQIQRDMTTPSGIASGIC
jgi:hypothetical protein